MGTAAAVVAALLARLEALAEVREAVAWLSLPNFCEVVTWRNQLYASWPAVSALIVAVLTVALTLANAVTPVPGAEPCIELGMREKIRERMVEGFDEGLRAHTKKMFEIWIQDDTDQPKRAINGMRSGAWAYARARAAAGRWDPLICKGG